MVRALGGPGLVGQRIFKDFCPRSFPPFAGIAFPGIDLVNNFTITSDFFTITDENYSCREVSFTYISFPRIDLINNFTIISDFLQLQMKTAFVEKYLLRTFRFLGSI